MEDEYEDVRPLDGNDSELQVYAELQPSRMDRAQVYPPKTKAGSSVSGSTRKNQGSADPVQGSIELEYEEVVPSDDGNESELEVYTELQPSKMDTAQEVSKIKAKSSVQGSLRKNQEPSKGRIRHVTIVLCVLGALGLVVVTAIATAALVLTLSSSSSSTPNMSTCQCQQEIQDLRHEIAANSRKITNYTDRIATFMERISDNGENIAINRERIATFGNKIAANGEKKTSTLAHIQNFNGCNTSIETMCTVKVTIGICTTTFIQYQYPGETVLDFICLRIQKTAELNPLIATAELVNNKLGCTCHVPNSFGPRLYNVVCGLQVTRCGVIN